MTNDELEYEISRLVGIISHLQSQVSNLECDKADKEDLNIVSHKLCASSPLLEDIEKHECFIGFVDNEHYLIVPDIFSSVTNKEYFYAYNKNNHLVMLKVTEELIKQIELDESTKMFQILKSYKRNKKLKTIL